MMKKALIALTLIGAPGHAAITSPVTANGSVVVGAPAHKIKVTVEGNKNVPVGSSRTTVANVTATTAESNGAYMLVGLSALHKPVLSGGNRSITGYLVNDDNIQMVVTMQSNQSLGANIMNGRPYLTYPVNSSRVTAQVVSERSRASGVYPITVFAMLFRY